jgi:hypothetical protein
MSSSNLDLVRSIYAAWERGDFSSWEHPDVHSEVEFMIADGPSPRRLMALAEMTEFWREFLGIWEDWRVQADEYRELDGERVLMLNQLQRAREDEWSRDRADARGGSGVIPRRNGKVTRVVLYWDRDLALADLGLAPQGGSPDS